MDAEAWSTARPRGVPTPFGIHELVAYDGLHRIDARAEDLQNLQISPFDLM
jgi:hypothetical protein